ncbi:MAG TPA: R3H domain-containing nucleic acid-binding protein, partial [Terriglobales bacterium]|nr:R3H domain-containing nucleic acid-binding protein [Terriglobales bacterium]
DDRQPIGPLPRPEAAEIGSSEPGAREDRHRRRRGRRGGRKRHEGAPGAAPAAPEPAESSAEAGVRPAPTHAPEVERPARPREPEPAEREGPSLSPDDLAGQGRRLTEELLKAMGFDATVTATVDGNHVEVTAEVAKDEDLLTGRKGEVRQALQHLLNRMLNRGESSRYHLQLEINDFWKRREEELRELARGLAEEAVAKGDEVVTEYLNAQERRIVHVTLREDARVKTYALGTGMIKRVAIAPVDFEGGPRDESESSDRG